jgi:hypothetical protein
LRDQVLGRSRGGLSTKVHLAVNDRGLPLAGGHAGDNPLQVLLLDAICVPPARLRVAAHRVGRLIADKA